MPNETENPRQAQTAPPPRPTAVEKPRAEQLKQYLESEVVKTAIAGVIPKHMKPERLIRIALQAAARNPELLECTLKSVALSLVSAAQLGLEAGGLLGSAYLVPFKNKHTGQKEAVLIPGYKGMIDLARRAGGVVKIDARLVRKGERFELDIANDKIVHVPRLDDDEAETVADDRPQASEADEAIAAASFDDVRGAYAIATYPDGSRQIEYMRKSEIESIRRRAKSKSGPWVTDWGQMARKTVIRRLAAYIPQSPHLAAALEIENAADRGDGANGIRDIMEVPDMSFSLPETTGGTPAELVETRPTSRVERVKQEMYSEQQQRQQKAATVVPTTATEPAKAAAPEQPPADPDDPGACIEPEEPQQDDRPRDTRNPRQRKLV